MTKQNVYFIFLDSLSSVEQTVINEIDSSTSNQFNGESQNKVLSSIVCSSGVKKKNSDSSSTDGNASQPSSNGTKKKVRPMSKVLQTESPQQEYYSIWNARECYETNPEEEIIECTEQSQKLSAPPLPPRNVNQSSQGHRPLERSWPHRMSRYNRLSPTEPFSFDIIDTDEPAVNDTATDDDHIEFIPGEFFAERRHAGDGQVNRMREECAPLATPETDGSLSENNVLRLGKPKSPETVMLKPLLKKKIGPDNYISTILTKKIAQSANLRDYSFPLNDISANETNNAQPTTSSCNLIGEFIPLKPHRPLSRQLSSGSSKRNLEVPGSSLNYNTEEVNKHFTLCRKPHVRSPRQRSPPSGSSTRSASPLTFEQASSSPEGAASPLAHLVKPTKNLQPSRLANETIGERPICPPTPTHHPRRLRSLSVSLGPPELRSRENFTHERSSSLDSRHIDLIDPNRFLTNADSSEIGGDDETSPTHVHISSTRLPSIPESARATVANDESLPSTWEARMDSHGRIFYIDHKTRTTSWQRPGGTGLLVGSGRDQHRQQLDRRYQSIRRTINRRNVPFRSDVVDTGEPEQELHPAVKMLCRPDFYSKLHTNEEALTVYNRNSALKHMILRIRRDVSCFERYQYNKDLVALVNCFARHDRDLPVGWESKLDATGKQFFIDHANRKTSFMDPRLPIECPRIRQFQQIEPQFDVAPIPPPRPALMPRPPISSPEVPVAYNDKVNK